MEYKKCEYDNYTVHFFNTDKFKSILLSTIFINEFTKESLTKSALLRRLLTNTNGILKTETDMVKMSYNLYNSYVGIENILHNNVLSTDFFMEILEDKYSEPGLLEKALDHYFNTIFIPNVENGKFDSNNFKLAKKSLSDLYDTEKDNKDRYAYLKAYEMIDPEYLRYPTIGYKECLDDLNEENMYEYYKEFLKSSNVNIFVFGNFDNDKVLNIINDRVKGKFSKNENKYRHNNFALEREVKEKIEQDKNNQSKLVMLFKLSDITDRERNVILPLFNRIFGLGSDSKLFKNVREKKSLAYVIRSNISREDNVLSVFAGINGESKDDVVKATKEELENMQNGKITDDEFNNAIISRRSMLNSFLDENTSILYSNVSKILTNNDDIDERIKNLETVTKNEIVEFSKKINLNIIYMLEGINKNAED